MKRRTKKSDSESPDSRNSSSSSDESSSTSSNSSVNLKIEKRHKNRKENDYREKRQHKTDSAKESKEIRNKNNEKPSKKENGDAKSKSSVKRVSDDVNGKHSWVILEMSRRRTDSQSDKESKQTLSRHQRKRERSKSPKEHQSKRYKNRQNESRSPDAKRLHERKIDAKREEKEHSSHRDYIKDSRSRKDKDEEDIPSKKSKDDRHVRGISQDRWPKSSQTRDFPERARHWDRRKDRSDRKTEEELEVIRNVRLERRSAITEAGAGQVWGASPEHIVE